MTDTSRLILEATAKLFRDLVTSSERDGCSPQMLDERAWASVVGLGLPMALVPEDEGGFGLTAAEAMGTVAVAAYFGFRLPLGEAMIANWLLSRASMPLCKGRAAIAAVVGAENFHLVRTRDSWRLSGTARRVPWSGAVETMLISASSESGARLVQLSIANSAAGGQDFTSVHASELSFDSLLVQDDCVSPPGVIDEDDLVALGAAIRVHAISGCLQRVVELTTTYATAREQFGKPIAKFQAVQQAIALLAEQAALGAAAAAILDRVLQPPIDHITVGAAKICAGEAATMGISAAHQVHGAIGFTMEHDLHHYTAALREWRDDFGTEAFWSARLGSAACVSGAGLWDFVTFERSAM